MNDPEWAAQAGEISSRFIELYETCCTETEDGTVLVAMTIALAACIAGDGMDRRDEFVATLSKAINGIAVKSPK